MRILVVRGGAIGDFILTLPVLAALRRRFPAARLEVLGHPHVARVAVAGGLADGVHSLEARAVAAFFARDAPLDEGLASFFAAFSWILSYLYDPDRVFRWNVARCSDARFIAGPHRPDERAGLHATEVLLGPLERLGIRDADPVPRLELPASPDAALAAGRWLAAHPGSGSERKNWPEARWSELLQSLVTSTDLGLLLVGGEAEGDRLERLRARLPESRIRLVRDLPLCELARLLSGCSAFVGHDSGITHLAASLGLPTLALWGESDEAVWRPRGDRVSLLRHPGGLRELGAPVVMERLASILGPLA